MCSQVEINHTENHKEEEIKIPEDEIADQTRSDTEISNETLAKSTELSETIYDPDEGKEKCLAT